MSDVSIFIFGCVVTLLCAGAIGVLVYAAWQDGEIDRRKRTRIEQPPPVSPSP